MVLLENILGFEITLVTKSRNMLELIIMKILHLKILHGGPLKVCSRSPGLTLPITKLKNVPNN